MQNMLSPFGATLRKSNMAGWNMDHLQVIFLLKLPFIGHRGLSIAMFDYQMVLCESCFWCTCHDWRTTSVARIPVTKTSSGSHDCLSQPSNNTGLRLYLQAEREWPIRHRRSLRVTAGCLGGKNFLECILKNPEEGRVLTDQIC